MSMCRGAIAIWVAQLAVCTSAAAGPWADMGDAQTRSDIEMAAATGLINNITMQWPMPWTGILGKLQDGKRIDALPDDVRDAAERLLAAGRDGLHLHRARAEIAVDLASDPATVRGYDALGRSAAQIQGSYEFLSTNTAIRLAVGTQKSAGSDRQSLMLDSSYIAMRLDGMIVYAGYLSHWWGPGWISTLSLSNNARPMPQVGFSRVQTNRSQSWLLSWLGPWQFETFVGVLDGPRDATNTGYVAMRFAFNPIPGLEIGLSRTTEICGSGHICSPLVDYFTFSNDPSHINRTNDQGSVDLRYTNMLFSRPFALYAQFMNEDTNPIMHSTTSRLYGGSVWLRTFGLTERVTLEYANSIATENIWGGNVQHGGAYNNYSYADGMRYRGRSLGFSLDSDSVLYSAQVSVVDSARRTLTLTYHRALASSPALYPPPFPWTKNTVTSSPVRFNMLEARVGVPLQWGEYLAQIETAVRWQDDQPRPDHGTNVAFEVALKLGI